MKTWNLIMALKMMKPFRLHGLQNIKLKELKKMNRASRQKTRIEDLLQPKKKKYRSSVMASRLWTCTNCNVYSGPTYICIFTPGKLSRITLPTFCHVDPIWTTRLVRNMVGTLFSLFLKPHYLCK